MTGSPSRSDFWAKLRYQDNDRSTGIITGWHPLVAHSADVAAVTEALLQRTILRKRLAQLLGWDALSDTHVARLCVFAALHDTGKVNRGFQNLAFDAQPTAGHVGPIINIIKAPKPMQWLGPLPLQHMLEWVLTEDELIQMLRATWGHHGKPVREKSFTKRLWTPGNDRDPVAGLAHLAKHVQDWFPEAFSDAKPFPTGPTLPHAFNGLLTLADWIGSDTRFFDYGTEDGAMDAARRNAARAIDALFLDADATRTALDGPTDFAPILGDWEPYPIQSAVRDLPLHETGSLAILESDTGSGKTEAALARFMRLFEAGLVDGMYFAVPTRSAATQLHGRITDAAKRLFSDARRPPVVQAVPGYIKADDAEGTRLPGFKVLWDDADENDTHRGWAAETSKRYLAAPIAVGTIDQVLLSALQASHAHMRAAALLRHFLVIDEVHASDVYMTSITDRVLDHHLRAGGHALLMSATLGASARTHLATAGRDSVPSPDEAVDTDYPLVTHVDATRRAPDTVHAASSGAQKTVTVTLDGIAGDPDAIARHALDAAQGGARVLIIRNLVDDCQAVQDALEAQASDPALLFGIDDVPAPHHSRFAPDDRTRLDDRIEAVFGKDERPVDAGRVAVATQTVEQSLDIDADLLLTDLCPMDVLLQRIGRLHRHTRKQRPEGYDTARCVVLTPAERDLTPFITNDGKAWKGPHGLGTVYRDLRMIEAAWRVLDDASVVNIPDDNRHLVERATHPDVLRGIVDDGDDRWQAHAKHILGEAYADRMMSGLAALDRSEPFGEEEFGDALDQIKTRLGQNDHRVLLPEPLPGPFGGTIRELSVSEWQLDGPPDTEDASNAMPFDGGFQFDVAGRSFRYDRRGLVQRE